MSSAPPAPGHIAQVDALRGIAAAAVAFIFHGGAMLGIWPDGILQGLPVFSWIYENGYVAVDLFFVISGYVFAHVYLTAEGLKRGTTFGSFMQARLARLYPLHFVMLIVSALITLAALRAGLGTQTHDDGWHFLLNLLFLQGSGLNDGYSFNVPAWSLSVEMLCYILFIILAMKGPRILRSAALALIALGILLSFDGDKNLVNIGRGLTGYFIGYLVWRHRDFAHRLPLHLLAALAILIVTLGVRVPGMHYGTFLSLTVWPITLIAAERTKYLSGAPLRWLGERSYSIYLIHSPIYLLLFTFLFGSERAPESMWTAATLAAIAATLILSDLSYRYLEMPARRRFRSGNPFARRPAIVPAE